MATKDKKRKPGKNPASAQSVAPVAEDKAMVPETVAQSAPVVKETPKPKAVKPAPVLTKKPSRLRFFVDAYLELRKAHWPSRREAFRLSLLVATVCVVVGLLLGVLDLGFSWLMRLLLFRS
jgi:preprotein translocase SecE subunit